MEQSISGSLPIGEPQKVCAMLTRRVFGWRRFVPLALGGVLGLTVCTSIALVTELNAPAPVALLVVVFIAVAGWQATRWILRRNAVAAVRARGAAAEVSLTWSLEPEGLKVCTDRGENLFYWSGIDEVARTRDHWVVMVLGMGYVLPRRFFADESAERRFFEPVWSRMTPLAKKRSETVTNFLNPRAA